jgi:hypothetical protein
MAEKKVETEVQTVEMNLDEILGQPGADSILVPDDENNEKPGIFSPVKTDTQFLDKTEKSVKEKAEDDKPEKIEDESEEDEESTNQEFLDNPSIEVEKKSGRPQGIVSVTKKLIEKGTIVPFEDTKKIEDYTEEDFEELYEANFQQMKDQLEKELPEQFFSQLPPELQRAYEYVANGGSDIKGLFYALAATQEMRDLDITSEDGQKYAVRSYLQATSWGTPEEIEDEINSLEDKGELSKKAKQFKPKLDAMQQQIVNQKLQNQALAQEQRAKQSQKYIDSVYDTLEKGELNGLRLDNKTQNMLYAGLIQSNYPSVSGRQTNLLGHLLEKYQWVEPRHDLIAEALWLLADPDGYKQNITTNVKKLTNKETIRKLKTEQANKESNTDNDYEEPTNKLASRTISRPKRNFFDRT